MLDECRRGELSQANYNFLHGLPTRAQITFWYAQKDNVKFEHPESCDGELRCVDCKIERERRNRLLNFDQDCLGAARKLADPRFSNCVLVTPFNKAVFQFAIHRAQNYAAAKQQQLFWMQAIDNPPNWFTDSMSKSELEEMKQHWLQYHAKKTEGILSLCPGCYDMPIRITHGNGYRFKEYGIHNGSTGVLKAWELDETDVALLKTATVEQVVLQALPKRLIIELSRPMKKQYPGMDHNQFPLSPVTVWWTLDQEGEIQIRRRGFPLVPNFSMTVDSATGKTLDTSLADLGDITVVPTFARAMKGYIALSRVRKAQDLYLPQPFSPALFRQGPQPWPSLLLEYLRGTADISQLEERAAAAKRSAREKQLLNSLFWTCASCPAAQRETALHNHQTENPPSYEADKRWGSISNFMSISPTPSFYLIFVI